GRRTPPPDAAHRARDARDPVVLAPSVDPLSVFRELWHLHHIVVASSDVQWRVATPPLRRSSRWSSTSSKTRAGGRELALPHWPAADPGRRSALLPAAEAV